jgi:transcriptional regulator with XRE-family HTH domain
MRRRDRLIDKRIGTAIRLQRMKLGLSQTQLGKLLGVTFQQVQKYEQGTNSVASTRIGDLCHALNVSPNELFGVGATLDSEAMRLSPADIRTVLRLRSVSAPVRRAFDALLDATPAADPTRNVEDAAQLETGAELINFAEHAGVHRRSMT